MTQRQLGRTSYEHVQRDPKKTKHANDADVQGSYRMVFTAIAVVNVIGALLVLFIKGLVPPQRGEAAPIAER